MPELPIQFDRPFALLQRRGEDFVHLLQGEAQRLDRLDDIPRIKGAPGDGEVFDTISAVPFAQIRERGFDAHADDAKVLCIRVRSQARMPIADFLAAAPEETIALKDLRYGNTPEEYKQLIAAVIENEIGNGEGANFVIPRRGRARIENMTPGKALTVFRRLVAVETGSYWNFLLFDGERYLVGGTPERHLLVRRGTVRMNPISGTFRKNAKHADLQQFRRDLLAFLADPKEINELFMVVDEELKMMAKLCGSGGMIVGPLLKEMASLIHTEYLLTGKSDRDPMDLFRGSMFAATVTGSPVENACKIICKYEKEARRYYASALVLIGRESSGEEFLDSPITIRTVEIDANGEALFQVGGTLVRNSDPQSELLETEVKISTLLTSIQRGPNPVAPRDLMPRLWGDDEISEVMQRRNQHLSRFWFFLQDIEEHVPALAGKTVTIQDNEDDFCFMFAHMLMRMGCQVEVKRFTEFDLAKDRSDLIVVGPGPGDPTDRVMPKMIGGRALCSALLKSTRPFMAVCLGHQFLCVELGLPVKRKRYPFQGTQEVIDYFGHTERVGFYNTFAGIAAKDLPGIEVACDPETREIHALRGERFLSVQFHAESILTKNGYAILRDGLLRLLT